jgi:hypothetical protein
MRTLLKLYPKCGRKSFNALPQRHATFRSPAMKALNIVKQLYAGELISIAVLIAAAAAVIYGVLS